MSENKRIAFWDIFKGVLIFLVVFTHFLYNYDNLGNAKYLVNVIYFFHMPAFIFISGYFSKRNITFKKALRLIILYLAFNTLFIIYTAITQHTLLALTPFFSYWYILALVAWRIIAKYLPSKINKWYIVIPASFVISLASGFFSDVTEILAIQKILGFLPFFFIGYYLPEKFIISYTKKRKCWVYVTGCIIFVLSLLSAYFISNNFDIQNYLLMDNYNAKTDIFIRLLVLGIAISASFGLFCMMPNTEKNLKFLQKWGRNSLWIYVFHRPITLVFAKVFVKICSGPTGLYILASIVMTLIVTVVFSSEKLNSLFNKVIDKVIEKGNEGNGDRS